MLLTPREKAQNKAARQIRDRAYNQRKRIYRKQMEQAEQDPEVLALRAKADEIDAQMDRFHEEREAKIAGLRKKIDELHQQINALHNSYEASGQASARSAAYGAWRKLMDAKKAQVEIAFPDLQGPARYSSAAWEPPADVLEQMEEARSNVKADPMNRKEA